MKVTSFLRFALFFVLAAFFSACGSKLLVQKATIQAWNGGAKGSRSGKNYIVYVQKPKSKIVTIDQIWLGDREKGWRMAGKVVTQLGQIENASVAGKGVKEFSIRFTEIQPAPQGMNMPNTIVPLEMAPKDLPENFDQGLAVYYRCENHSGIWVIEDFVTLPTINYP